MAAKTETLYIRGVPSDLVREVKNYAKSMGVRGASKTDAVCDLLRFALDMKRHEGRPA